MSFWHFKFVFCSAAQLGHFRVAPSRIRAVGRLCTWTKCFARGWCGAALQRQRDFPSSMRLCVGHKRRALRLSQSVIKGRPSTQNLTRNVAQRKVRGHHTFHLVRGIFSRCVQCNITVTCLHYCTVVRSLLTAGLLMLLSNANVQTLPQQCP